MESLELEKYITLRRLPEYTKKVAAAFKNGKDVSPPLDVEKYGKAVSQLYYEHTLNIWTTLLRELDIADHSAECLEKLTELLAAFLTNTNVIDPTHPEHVTKKVFDNMEEFNDKLKKLGEHLLTHEHDVTLMQCFLKLVERRGVAYILLLDYNDAYRENVFCANACDDSPVDFSYIHNFLTPDEWKLIATRVKNFGEEKCSDLLVQLIVQNIRAKQVLGIIPDKHVEKALKYIFANKWGYKLLNADFALLLEFVQESQLTNLCEVVVDTEVEVAANQRRDVIAATVYVILRQATALLAVPKKKSSNKNSKVHGFVVNLQEIIGEDVSVFLQLSRMVTFSTADPACKILEHLGRHIMEFLNETDVGKTSNISETRTLVEMLTKFPIAYMSIAFKALVFLFGMAFKAMGITSDILWTVLTGIMESEIPPPVMQYLNGHFLLWISQTDCSTHLLSLLFGQAVKNQKTLLELDEVVKLISSAVDSDANILCQMALLMKSFFKESCNPKAKAAKRNLCGKYLQKLCCRLQKYLTDVDVTSLPPNVTGSLFDASAVALEVGSNTSVEVLVSTAFELCAGDNSVVAAKAYSFLQTVQKQPRSFDLPSDFTEKMKCLAVQHSTVTPVLYETANFKEFSELVEFIVDFLGSARNEEKLPDISHIAVLWESLVIAKLGQEKNQVRSKAVQRCMSYLQGLVIDAELDDLHTVIVPAFTMQIKLLSINTKLVCPQAMAMCFHSCNAIPLSSIESYAVYTTCFESVCQLLNAFLLHHSDVVLERISPFLQCMQKLVESLSSMSSQEKEVSDEDLQRLRLCSFHLERLCKIVKTHKKDFHVVAPYFISIMIKQLVTHTLYPSVKDHYILSLSYFLDICDENGTRLLQCNMPEGLSEVFESIYNDYKKHYKYTGKV